MKFLPVPPLLYPKSCVYIGDIYHDIKHDIAGVIAPYLLTLGNRNDPISVAMPNVAKASTIVAVMCHCCQGHCLKYNANVNYQKIMNNFVIQPVRLFDVGGINLK